MTTKVLNAKKKNFLTTCTSEDYRLYTTYNRMADVLEIFRILTMGSLADKTELVQVKGLDHYYYMKNGSLSLEYQVEVISQTEFRLNELKVGKVTEFERTYDSY